MLARDQAPHWGKRGKKGAVGEKPRRKGDAALSPLPRSPLGSLRSPIFFLFDPVFCLFPLLRCLVPRYIHASHCDYTVPFFFNLYNRPFPSFHSPFFSEASQTEWRESFHFPTGISCFPLSMLSTLDLL